jgi:hypothetical protein
VRLHRRAGGDVWPQQRVRDSRERVRDSRERERRGGRGGVTYQQPLPERCDDDEIQLPLAAKL